MTVEDDIYEALHNIFLAEMQHEPEKVKQIIKDNIDVFTRTSVVTYVQEITGWNISSGANVELEKLSPTGKIGGGAVELTADGLKSSGVLEIDSVGVVHHGQSKHQQEVESNVGLKVRSPNGHKWRCQISNTGQWVATDLDT